MSVAISALVEQIIKTTNTFDDGSTFAGTIESLAKNGLHTLTHTPTGDSDAIFAPWMAKVHVDLSSGDMRTSGALNTSHGIAGYKYFLISGTGDWSQQFADESKLKSSNTGTGNSFSFYKVATDTVTGTINNVKGLDCDLDLDALSLTYTDAYAVYAPQSMWGIELGGTVTAGKYNIGSPTELTISSGAVTITSGFHSIDTESDAASDDLNTINGGVAGDRLVVRAQDDGRTVVLKQYTGGGDNLLIGADITLDHSADLAELVYNGLFWQLLSFNSNA